MISVTMIVKNGERCLKEVLGALKDFDEVIVADTGSSDQTLAIAKTFPNVTVTEIPFYGFGEARNKAAELAKNEWILSIDCDEVLSCELAQEILSLSLDNTSIYSIPFYNYFNGKHIKWCGWHPEEHARLYHRKTTSFCTSLVHEGLITRGLKVKKLKHPLHHYPYADISDFLIKMERYSTLFAKQYAGKRKSSPLIAFTHGSAAFFKSYICKRGFLGGYEGFLISRYNGQTAFYKYLKLYHLNRSNACCNDVS